MTAPTGRRDSGQKTGVRQFFDGNEGWGGKYYSDGGDPFGQMLVRRQAHVFGLMRRHTGLEGKRVFDAGCGPGAYLREIAATAGSVVGMDASTGMLRASDEMRRGQGIGDRVALIRGDLERIPLKERSCDVIFCVGVLGYLRSDEQALSELHRVLVPGGYALFNVRNLNALTSIHYTLRLRARYLRERGRGASASAVSLATHGEQRAWKSRAYRIRRFESLLDRAGFEQVEGITFGYELKFLSKAGMSGAGIARLEERLEKLLMNFPLGLFRNAGWGYIGLYRRRT